MLQSRVFYAAYHLLATVLFTLCLCYDELCVYFGASGKSEEEAPNEVVISGIESKDKTNANNMHECPNSINE